MSTLVLVFALVGVGLTAPADSPFSITIEPVFLTQALSQRPALPPLTD